MKKGLWENEGWAPPFMTMVTWSSKRNASGSGGLLAHCSIVSTELLWKVCGSVVNSKDEPHWGQDLPHSGTSAFPKHRVILLINFQNYFFLPPYGLARVCVSQGLLEVCLLARALLSLENSKSWNVCWDNISPAVKYSSNNSMPLGLHSNFHETALAFHILPL